MYPTRTRTGPRPRPGPGPTWRGSAGRVGRCPDRIGRTSRSTSAAAARGMLSWFASRRRSRVLRPKPARSNPRCLRCKSGPRRRSILPGRTGIDPNPNPARTRNPNPNPVRARPKPEPKAEPGRTRSHWPRLGGPGGTVSRADRDNVTDPPSGSVLVGRCPDGAASQVDSHGQERVRDVPEALGAGPVPRCKPSRRTIHPQPGMTATSP